MVGRHGGVAVRPGVGTAWRRKAVSAVTVYIYVAYLVATFARNS